jgi:hypothetical protein
VVKNLMGVGPARNEGRVWSIDKTALVGADVAGDIPGAQVSTDDLELSFLIAESCLQCAQAKPEETLEFSKS